MEGQHVSGDSITFNGHVIGGTIDEVVMWDEKYNVGIQCGTSLSLWSLTIPLNRFSNGLHTMCIRAKNTDGQWSPIVCRTIYTSVTIPLSGPVYPTGYIADTLPSPIGIVFRPIEDVARNVIVYVQGGTAPDDQNGDNIPDQFQQSPITPNYNQSNVPILIVIVFASFVVLIIVVVFAVKEVLSRREERMSKWGWREWELNKAKMKEKDKFLKKEISRREKLINLIRDKQGMEQQLKQQKKEIHMLYKERQLFNNAIQKIKTSSGKTINITLPEGKAVARKTPTGTLNVSKAEFEAAKQLVEKKRNAKELERYGFY
jgi:hypothetical protein